MEWGTWIEDFASGMCGALSTERIECLLIRTWFYSSRGVSFIWNGGGGYATTLAMCTLCTLLAFTAHGYRLLLVVKL